MIGKQIIRLVDEIGIRAVMKKISGYIAEADPDYVKECIESMSFPFLEHPEARRLASLARRIIVALASRDPGILELIDRELSVENVFRFVRSSNEFIAGVIYGHPRGMEWLSRLINEIKRRIGVVIVEAEVIGDEGGGKR